MNADTSASLSVSMENQVPSDPTQSFTIPEEIAPIARLYPGYPGFDPTPISPAQMLVSYQHANRVRTFSRRR